MCTILTISRDVYEQDIKAFEHRTRVDATSNHDGFAIVLMGETEKDVLTMQTRSFEVAMNIIKQNTKWKRLFLHSRAATTVTKNIFSCHNFFSSGNGEDTGVGKWIIQHNGYISDKAGSGYVVDSMHIGALIREDGVDQAISKLISTESYTNAFLINPDTGEYRVVRCFTNTLYTDGKGNYSTKILGKIRKPVPFMSQKAHSHDMKKTNKYYTPIDWDTSSKRSFYEEDSLNRDEFSYHTPSTDAEWDRYIISQLTAHDKLGYLRDEDEDLDNQTDALAEIVGYDIQNFGEEAIVYQDDQVRFYLACSELGYGSYRKIPNRIYGMLSQEQKGWFRNLKKILEDEGETILEQKSELLAALR